MQCVVLLHVAIAHESNGSCHPRQPGAGLVSFQSGDGELVALVPDSAQRFPDIASQQSLTGKQRPALCWLRLGRLGVPEDQLQVIAEASASCTGVAVGMMNTMSFVRPHTVPCGAADASAPHGCAVLCGAAPLTPACKRFGASGQTTSAGRRLFLKTTANEQLVPPTGLVCVRVWCGVACRH